MTAHEGDAFASSGDLRQDILGLTAVHPLRESAMRASVASSGGSIAEVAALLATGELKLVSHAGEVFHVRRLQVDK